MSKPVFGKSITRSFIVDDGEGALSLPSQSPTIYLFTTQPTRIDAIAGTGATQTITAWTANNSSYDYQFAAVTDPDPASSNAEIEYWEAIKYVLQTAGSVQTKIRSFTIARAEVAISKPGTSLQDIKDVWSGVSNYIGDSQLGTFLEEAETLMRLKFGKKAWVRLGDLEDAKFALAYKAIILMAETQIAKGFQGDKFEKLAIIFQNRYKEILASTSFPQDTDGDGKEDSIITKSARVIDVSR